MPKKTKKPCCKEMRTYNKIKELLAKKPKK
jgi:hypothetical protein